jgi:acetyl-CoA C-acetyltransferase
MRKVAVIGAGMTLFRRRLLETGKEMCFQAVQMALEEAGLELSQVDAVVSGSAPDAFDGVHMKGEYLLDGAGGVRKPYMRVFTGGGTGCFSPIAGWWHIASGLADVVLVVNEEKMSSVTPHPQYAFANIWDPILDRPLNPNLVWIFAMEMNRYMTVHGIEKADIARVAVKNKRNAVDHPAAQLADPNITVDDVLNSEVMAWPVQRLDISPPSDGASALVLASEDVAREVSETPVWISGVGWCIDSTMWTNRDLVFPEYLARAAPGGGDPAGRGTPDLPLRGAVGGRQPHRGHHGDQDGRDLLAACGEGGPPTGSREPPGGGVPGLGRPDAVLQCDGHEGVRSWNGSGLGPR